MIAAMKFIYILALSIWTGEMVFFSFVGAPSLFKTLKRDDAAKAAERMIAGYYLIMYICAAVALAASMILAVEVRGTNKELLLKIINIIILAAMAAGAVYSGFFLKRQMDRVAQQIHSFEGAPEDEPARVEYNQLHKKAERLNLAVLILGLAAIFLLSLRVKF